MQKVFEKIIKKLEEESFLTTNDDGETNELSIGVVDLKDAIEVVKQVAAEYNNGWIPCSERMPEPGEIVLVQQIYSWEHFEEGAVVTVGRLRPTEDGRVPYWEFQYYRPDFRHGTIMDNAIICPGSEYVTHWQPLPEQYQTKGE